MFTGLVETTGRVIAVELTGDGASLSLFVGSLASDVAEGESIAVNGCCLTVTTIDITASSLRFDLLAQTLRVTNLGDLVTGDTVNLERAMALGERFGGHFVQGHVDATARILDWSEHGQDHRLEVELPPEFRGLVIPKGSICLDGISLTAADVTDTSLTCWIIPHTIKVTNLQQRKSGQRLNIEFDMLGKYAAELGSCEFESLSWEAAALSGAPLPIRMHNHTIAAPPPPGFQLQSRAAYDRRHRTFPAKTRRDKAIALLEDIGESLIARFSIYGDPPAYDSRDFPWTQAVEADWQKVRSELDNVMHHREAMPSFQEIVKEVGNIQQDDQWKTFFLKGVGMDCTENARRCPETMKVLNKIPGCTTGFFSILSPHKHIPHHRGPWAGVLRLHLGLLVPEPQHLCRIRIADQFHAWSEGECLVFDDTYNHEVWNDTDGYRAVLFVDFERPLRWPLNIINHWIMHLASLAPFMREAKGKQKASEKKFWQKFSSPAT